MEIETQQKLGNQLILHNAQRIDATKQIQEDLTTILSCIQLIECEAWDEEAKRKKNNKLDCWKAVHDIQYQELIPAWKKAFEIDPDMMQIYKHNPEDPKTWCVLLRTADRYPKVTLQTVLSTQSKERGEVTVRSTGQYQISHVVLASTQTRPASFRYKGIKSLVASHRCHMSHCINPNHLEWADRSLNEARQECNANKKCNSSCHVGYLPCIIFTVSNSKN